MLRSFRVSQGRDSPQQMTCFRDSELSREWQPKVDLSAIKKYVPSLELKLLFLYNYFMPWHLALSVSP